MGTTEAGKRREFAMNDKTKGDLDRTADSAQKALGPLEAAVREMIENQPYTATAIALGIGWLFGRMHRPF